VGELHGLGQHELLIERKLKVRPEDDAPGRHFTKGMQMLGVRGMGLAAALTFGAVAWWASRGTNPAAEGFAQVRATPASHAEALTANAWSAATVKDDTVAAGLSSEPVEDGADVSFDDYVEDKYRLLFTTSTRTPRDTASLRQALRDRERVMVAINTARQGTDADARTALPRREEELAAVDQRIGALLPAGDIALFDALKDSHIEQFQLDDYARGISNVAPLRDADHQSILLSKLTARQRFRAVLDQSGLMRSDLTPEQRQAALGNVSRALRESRDSFLQEARQRLTDDMQYSLLANYENGEFDAELEKLQRIAAGQGG
jgi:hypothetical protein